MSELPDPRPVPRLFLDAAAASPERVALVHPRGGRYRDVTYGALADRVARLTRGLRQRGVGAGDRVVVLIPMSPELYAVILAIACAGATAVFVEPTSGIAEIARTIRLTRAKAFIGVPKAHVLRLMSRAVAAVPVAIVVGNRAAAAAARAETLAAVESGEPADRTSLRFDPAAPALLTFSSGSTGTPKGATRSHRFVLAQHRAIEQMSESRPGDVHLSAFAMVHLSTLASGHTAIIPRLGRGGVNQVDGAEIADLIGAYGATVVSGSPAFLTPIFEAAAQRARPLTSVRRVASGGAPVPVSLCETADAVLPNGSFLVVYGSTECEPICTIESAEVVAETAPRTRAGAGLCVGRPHTDVRLRLLRSSRDPLRVGPGGIDALCVTDGDVGEVAVAGPHVNERYYRNRSAERACKLIDEHGVIWHRTGDAAYRDERGRIWVVGRTSDVVERGEQRYHPAAVEALVRTHPMVARAALVAANDGAAMVVEPRARVRRRSAKARRLEHELRAKLAAANVHLDAFHLSAELPTDPRHRAKLDYPAIRRSLQPRRIRNAFAPSRWLR